MRSSCTHEGLLTATLGRADAGAMPLGVNRHEQFARYRLPVWL